MAIGVSPDGYINPGTEWDITLLQNNDNDVPFQISNGPVPLDITGWVITMYLKGSATANDLTAFSNTPPITNALLGEFTVNFPAAQITTPTLVGAPLFYHVDGYQNVTFPFTTTLVYGTVTILPM